MTSYMGGWMGGGMWIWAVIALLVVVYAIEKVARK